MATFSQFVSCLNCGTQAFAIGKPPAKPVRYNPPTFWTQLSPDILQFVGPFVQTKCPKCGMDRDKMRKSDWNHPV